MKRNKGKAKENPFWKVVAAVSWRGTHYWKVVNTATGVARYVPQYIKVNGVNLIVTRHAAYRMAERRINVRTVKAVIREGERFYDQRERHQSYIAWDKKKRIAVALSPKDRWGKRTIKTVMDDVTENKVKERVDEEDWVKRNWRL
ncbi:DUF4258 domain-containing protein [Peptococcaceae bacterium]|nr:DUF4258 domain-containing protein [Peptococcaceae bacterium]